jgi:preprotein translocase subunit SecA
MRDIWGKLEIERAAENSGTFKELNEGYRHQLEKFIDPDARKAFDEKDLRTLAIEENQSAIDVFGRFVQQSLYRQILLRAISNLWIEQLTRMEALRISIGMEAYAKLDPLVQYKSRSTDEFKNLFADIRMGVISRMFRLHPIQKKSASSAPPAPANQTADKSTQKKSSKKKKRKRYKKH